VVFGKRPSPYYGKNSSNKQRERQSIITLRNERQSIRKISRTPKVSSSAVARTIKHRVQVTDTSQHQLFRGDCLNQALMVELLQRNHY
jgi:predicted exporter